MTLWFKRHITGLTLLAFLGITILVFRLEMLPISLFFVVFLGVIAVLTRRKKRVWLLALPFVAGFPVTLFIFILAYWSSGLSWQLAVQQGFAEGMLYWLRIATLVLANIIFIHYIDRNQLLQALKTSRLPRSLLILLFSVINLFPVLFKEGQRIIEVQRTRGIALRHLFTRHHFLPLLIPLLMTIIQRSTEMAVSIHLRREI
jgi:energy-coupling factor transporter transmembrane protein EcfT